MHTHISARRYSRPVAKSHILSKDPLPTSLHFIMRRMDYRSQRNTHPEKSSASTKSITFEPAAIIPASCFCFNSSYLIVFWSFCQHRVGRSESKCWSSLSPPVFPKEEIIHYFCFVLALKWNVRLLPDSRSSHFSSCFSYPSRIGNCIISGVMLFP